MKASNVFLLIATIGLIGSIHIVTAATPADTVIKNAQADIIRFEGQANGLTTARKSSARRILKLLALSHKRLKGSSHQSDVSWQEVDKRFISLTQQLNNLMQPSKTSANPVTKKIPANPSSPTPSTKKTSKSNASIRPLVSGERVRVKKLARDIASMSSIIITEGPSLLQNPVEIAKRQKRLKQFKEALARYPQLDDPDVQLARKEYQALHKKLLAEFKRAKGQLTQLGDVQQRLTKFEANNQKYPVPELLKIPFSEADAKAWVKAGINARTVAEHNHKELKLIAPIAYLPNNPGTPQAGAPYDANDIKRLQYNATKMFKDVQAGYLSLAEKLKNRLDQIDNDLLSRFKEDPDGDKRWLFIGEGRQQQAMKLYNESIPFAQSSIYLERTLNREPKQALAMLKKIEAAKKEFLGKVEIALKTSKLPEAKSDDKKLLTIAKQIIEKPKYKFGQHAKIILTTNKIVDRERKDSQIDIDDAEVTLGGKIKMSGTETTWTYKWQEFKFATALKETDNDIWYIWWITAKNFSSGGNRTPLNQWISGKSTKGNRILKANISP